MGSSFGFPQQQGGPQQGQQGGPQQGGPTMRDVRVQLLSFGTIVFLLAVAAVLWLSMRRMRQTKRIVVPGTRSTVRGDRLTQMEVPTLVMSNGNRMSITFWVYIHDPTRYLGTARHVFHVGVSDAKEQAVVGASLGENDNALTIRVGAATVKAPYIPSHRWVHIACVMQDTFNGGSLAVFLDGREVPGAASTQQPGGATQQARLVASSPITVAGSLYAGGDGRSYSGFSGLLSSVRFANYEMNIRDIVRDMRQGPVDGFLARVGLGAYALRTPVYKIG